ncbi:MAG: YbhN family protein [Candidatus Hermodarchaeota archaeon]
MEEENKSKFINWLKRRKRLLIGLATLLLLISMIIFVNFVSLIQKIITIGLIGLIIFAIIYTIGFLIRAYKLKLIFKGINIKVGFFPSYFSTGAGLIVNDLTPAKIGDIIRILILKDHEKLKLSESTAGIAIERILDFILIFIISCFALLFLYFSNYGESSIKETLGSDIQFFLALGIIFIIIIIILLVFLLYKTDLIIRFINRFLPKLANYLNRFVRNFKKGIREFSKHKKIFVVTILLGIPTWLVDGFIVILFFYILGYRVNMFVIILATVLINLSKTFPITPGGWGISENVGALFIFFFYPAIGFPEILQIFLIDHFLRTAYLIIFGGYSLLHYNISLKDIGSAKKQV